MSSTFKNIPKKKKEQDKKREVNKSNTINKAFDDSLKQF